MNNKKGLLLLVLGIVILFFSIDLAFFLLVNNTLHRVNLMKRTAMAENLFNTGVKYLSIMNSKYGTSSPDKIFPGKELRTEKNGRQIKYIYTSPNITKGGFFTFEYYYSDGMLNKIICTGSFEGYNFSREVK